MPDIPGTAKHDTHDEYEPLVKAAQTEAIIKVAVVHPCDDVSLGDALEAAQLRLNRANLRGTLSSVCGMLPRISPISIL